jgi:hypothetical protein
MLATAAPVRRQPLRLIEKDVNMDVAFRLEALSARRRL